MVIGNYDGRIIAKDIKFKNYLGVEISGNFAFKAHKEGDAKEGSVYKAFQINTLCQLSKNNINDDVVITGGTDGIKIWDLSKKVIHNTYSTQGKLFIYVKII